mmetsp:Transcript_13995/g.27914  ORF Transcript_13995/g.27914 Transcript_13995/m.27914 type:complete len:295 (+) Transcript_13995:1478-2362(+)
MRAEAPAGAAVRRGAAGRVPGEGGPAGVRPAAGRGRGMSGADEGEDLSEDRERAEAGVSRALSGSDREPVAARRRAPGLPLQILPALRGTGLPPRGRPRGRAAPAVGGPTRLRGAHAVRVRGGRAQQHPGGHTGGPGEISVRVRGGGRGGDVPCRLARALRPAVRDGAGGAEPGGVDGGRRAHDTPRDSPRGDARAPVCGGAHVCGREGDQERTGHQERADPRNGSAPDREAADLRKTQVPHRRGSSGRNIFCVWSGKCGEEAETVPGRYALGKRRAGCYFCQSCIGRLQHRVY